jgi:uncharacterized protein YuzE
VPFKYDANANALYYRLTTAPVQRTIAIGDRVNVDVDATGEAVGIEVLDPPGFSVSPVLDASVTSTAASVMERAAQFLLDEYSDFSWDDAPERKKEYYRAQAAQLLAVAGVPI